MKSFPYRLIFLLLALAPASVSWLRADDPPASRPPAPAAAEALTAEQQAEEARQQAEKALAAAEAALAKARAEAEKTREAALAADQDEEKSVAKTKERRANRRPDHGDSLSVGDDNHVPEDVTVPHNAIAVMGDLKVDGEVMHDAVAVMGDNTVNGRVHSNVVAIMGDINLGPKAEVDGDLVCVGGEVHRDPGAVVRGRVQMKTMGLGFNSEAITNWWDHALKIGRPLAIGAGLGWLWFVTGFSIAFYALLGLVFPRRICACGDKLVQEPGLVILSAVLATLALPVLFVLLCITIIGIPVALLVLPASCVVIAMFGKAAIYGLVGRKLTGERFHPVVAVIIGAVLFVLLYLLPVIGLLLAFLVWFLGFGCAVLLMFGRPKPVAATPGVTAPTDAPPPAVTSTPEPAPGATATPADPAPAFTSGARAVSTMVVTADTAPRAGFWIRLGAAMLDFMLIVIPLAMLGLMEHGPALLFLGVAAYNATMWQLKGTTVGGVICGLKVVRLDDRPIDWGIAIVRALGGFLSLFVAGIGFIWVAFDDEKQSWHDKIAGTTIVKVPKGTALL